MSDSGTSAKCPPASVPSTCIFEPDTAAIRCSAHNHTIASCHWVRKVAPIRADATAQRCGLGAGDWGDCPCDAICASSLRRGVSTHDPFSRVQSSTSNQLRRQVDCSNGPI